MAAACNEGRNTPNAPARFSEVIGVAASNATRENACFTNLGDLAAPGGDGITTKDGGRCTLDEGRVCDPNQGCESGIISMISQNASKSGYAFWQGTSFAAPQVSGLAALLLEKHPGLPTSEVREVIECGLTQSTSRRLGLGIIDLEKTINNFVS